jgi:hypothetical protein
MFALNINHPHVTSMTTHPSRETALGQLDQFLDGTDHRPRVVAATWTHASYEILGATGNRVIGHAVIDELCACAHPERDHEETGCTAISLDAGPVAECRCTGHRPLSGDPALFDLDVPT